MRDMQRGTWDPILEHLPGDGLRGLPCPGRGVASLGGRPWLRWLWEKGNLIGGCWEGEGEGGGGRDEVAGYGPFR